MPIRLLPRRSSKRGILLSVILVVFLCFYFNVPGSLPSRSSLSGTARYTRQTLSHGPGISSTLVIAATSEDDTSWTINNFNKEMKMGLFKTAVYVVDDESTHYQVPANKGHEVMVYLTYIIDHYHKLSDVTIFMHNHQITWHNNDLLLSDAVAIVKHLRRERVLRYGYMNLRCHHDPGCPAHVNLDTTENDITIPEAIIMKQSWQQLFPNTSIPKVLSQPCCAQFAVSARRIREIPLERYVSYRDWVINTDLSDSLSGRVWEYLWQWVFAGVEELCPEEHICYCDGYGVCMGNKENYDAFFILRESMRKMEEKINGDKPDKVLANLPIYLTKEEEAAARTRVESISTLLDRMRQNALKRGADVEERAMDLGTHHST